MEEGILNSAWSLIVVFKQGKNTSSKLIIFDWSKIGSFVWMIGSPHWERKSLQPTDTFSRCGADLELSWT